MGLTLARTEDRWLLGSVSLAYVKILKLTRGKITLVPTNLKLFFQACIIRSAHQTMAFSTLQQMLRRFCIARVIYIGYKKESEHLVLA